MDKCPKCQEYYRADRYDGQAWRHLCSCELRTRLRCNRCKTLATHYLLGQDGSEVAPACGDHGVPDEDVGPIVRPVEAPPAERAKAKEDTPRAAAKTVVRFASLEVFTAEVRKNDYLVTCKHCLDEHRHGDRLCITDDYGAFDTRCPKCRKAGYYTTLAVRAPGVTQARPNAPECCVFCGATRRSP